LEYISNDLHGEKLAKNIKLCNEKPEECKITKDYPKIVKDLTKKIEDLSQLPNSLIPTIINDDFHKQVSDKIRDEVYPEVSKCIHNLKNE
jgi:hypothetical protein